MTGTRPRSSSRRRSCGSTSGGAACATARPWAYAHTILSNLHTDGWRRRGREVLRDEVPDTAYSIDPVTTDLVRALQQLSPRERECIVLRHYLDLFEKDTAVTLGISVGSVKSYTSKGLAGLRPLLAVTKEERHV